MTARSFISQFEGISFIDEETIEGKYTDVHVIKFKVDNGDGTSDTVTGFYWSEIDPKYVAWKSLQMNGVMARSNK